MEPVPVAEKLLETKLFGFSVKKLLQSFGAPMAPGLILTVLNFPAIIFGPVVVSGLIVGGFVYFRTPAGQNPAEWLVGLFEYTFGPDSFHWKPKRIGDGETIIADGGRSFIEPSPSEDQTDDSLIGSANTLDNVDFKAIHDDGVIETEEAYVLIVEVVKPRQWLILDNQSRDAVIRSYQQFLMGLKSPIQTFTMPVPYDASEYIEQILDANRNKPEDESKALEYGRIIHTQWIQRVVDEGKILDRRYFITVTAHKHRKNELGSDDGFLARLNPVQEDVDLEKRYDQLWSRAQNVASGLPRTGVETEILDDRADVLEVLYYYYKGRYPPENIDHSWLTQAADAGTSQARADITRRASQATSD